MSKSFTHLHVHTEYSTLDGAAKLKPLAERAAALGMPALGMTDHGNMFGAYDFYKKTGAAGIKPVIGIEAYIAPGSRRHDKPVFWGNPGKRAADADGEGGDVSGGGAYLHMTMLAENAQGLRNLFWLSSQASLTGFYRKPRQDAELIAERASGIIATTGCPSGEVQTRLRLGQIEEAVKAAGKWRDIFGKDNFFLELMDHGLKIETQVRDGLLEVARRVGLKPLATNDSHYVAPEDADTHDTLLCVGIGKTKDDPARFKFDGDGYYLKSAQEMRELWDAQVPGACDNTLLIAERVGSYDEVFAYRDLMPRFDVPDGHTQDSWLREEATRGLAARYGEITTELSERMEYELGVIARMGFSAYFLVVADICRHARDNGIAVGPGRGSAAGSLVAYVMRITELDPIRHKLMFERFLNPERVSPPDADLDFDERRRADMIRYVTEKYGSEHVGQIITMSTIKAKGAIKDAARVLDQPYSLGEKLSKLLPAAAQGDDAPLAALDDEDHARYAELGPLRDYLAVDEEARKVIEAARGLEGFVRSTGVHAAGAILSAEPLIDVLPLSKRQNDGAIICGFEYPQAEAMGLLKIDFLGLRNLTILSDTLKAIKARLGIDVDLDSLELDDPKTYELLARGDTLGVFQLDGSGMQQLLRMMKPDKFDDISAAGALYRPGPMGADSHTNYALRKHGKQPITAIHPQLKEPLAEILDETYGLIVYQEQVMAIAQKVAGYSLAQADLLRRAMGKKKKEELDRQYENFKAGMNANGFSDEAVRTLWDLLLPFSDYAFNRAHSAAYGLLAYWTAYLKANYPADYMAAVLTSVGDNKDKMGIYLAECRHMGIKVLPPDVNASGAHFTAVGDDEVRFGLNAVRNVGAGAVESISDGRRGKPYVSFGDFLTRCGQAACTKRGVEALIKAGAFDSLGHPRQGMWQVHIPAVENAAKLGKKAELGFESLFADEDLDAVNVPDVEWDRKLKLTYEREMLGLYVSDHPLNGCEELLENARTISIAAMLEEGRDEAKVTISGMATRVEHRMSKKGNPWGLVALEDLTSTVEVVLFGEAYQLAKGSLEEDVIYSIEGKLQVGDGRTSVIVDRITRLESVDSDRPVELFLTEADLTPEIVQELRFVLKEHAGEKPVRVYLRREGKTVLLSLPEYPVDPTAGFASDVKSLLGREALRKSDDEKRTA